MGIQSESILIERVEFKNFYQPVLKIKSINLPQQDIQSRSSYSSKYISFFLNIFKEIHIRDTFIGDYYLEEIIAVKQKKHQFTLGTKSLPHQKFLVSLRSIDNLFKIDAYHLNSSNYIKTSLSHKFNELHALFQIKNIHGELSCSLNPQTASCSLSPIIIKNGEMRIKVQSLKIQYPLNTSIIKETNFEDIALSLDASAYNQTSKQEYMIVTAKKERGKKYIDIEYNDRFFSLDHSAKKNKNFFTLTESSKEKVIGRVNYDKNNIEFNGELEFGLLNEAIIAENLILHKITLYKALMNMKDKVIHLHAKGSGSSHNLIGIDNQLYLKADLDNIVLSAHDGTLNSQPLKKMEYDTQTQKAEIIVSIGQKELLNAINYQSKYLGSQEGELTYTYEKDEKSQLQQTYHWTPIKSDAYDDFHALKINEIFLKDINNQNTVDLYFSLHEMGIKCHGTQFDPEFLMGNFSCTGSSLNHSLAPIKFQAKGVKCADMIHGGVEITEELTAEHHTDKLKFQYDSIKNILNLTSDYPSKELNLNHKHTHHLFADINFNKQDIKLRTSHEKLEIETNLLLKLAALFSHPNQTISNNSWKIDNLNRIKQLNLDNLSFNDITLTINPQFSHSFEICGDYLESKGKVSVNDNNINFNFNTLNIDQVSELIGSSLYKVSKPKNFSQILKNIKNIKLKSEKTIWKSIPIDTVSIESDYDSEKNIFKFYEFNIQNKDLDHHSTGDISKDSIASHGTVTLYHLPEFLKEYLHQIGIITAHGEISYSLEYTSEKSTPKLQAYLSLKDCQVKHKSLQKIKIIDILSGRFIENQKVNLADKDTFLIDEVDLKIDIINEKYIQVPFCVMKAGSLISTFKGVVSQDYIDGEVTVIPRITKLLPTAAFASGQILVGSASLLIDAMLGEQLSKIASERYLVRGSMADIQISKKYIPAPLASYNR